MIKTEHRNWKGGLHRDLRVPKTWGDITSSDSALLSPTHLCSAESVLIGDLARPSSTMEFQPPCKDADSFFILSFFPALRKIHVSMEGEIRRGCLSFQMTKACCLKEKLSTDHNEDAIHWKSECS